VIHGEVSKYDESIQKHVVIPTTCHESGGTLPFR
jgi:hypothetical protein